MTTDTRKLEIAKIINTVAKYYGVSAKKVYYARYSKKPMEGKARVVVWHHLHACGMSYHSISESFGMGYDNVQKRVKQGRVCISEEDLILIATLPKIPNTLEIVKSA